MKLFGGGNEPERPSPWFTWHAHLFRSGTRVLDLACGKGRHAIAAALLGAEVTAIDIDGALIAPGQKFAEKRGLPIRWVTADLTTYRLPEAAFDVVMSFNFLDRDRMPAFLHAVAPGGHFLAETFLETQRAHGWGPKSDHHLLAPAELWGLIEPLDLVFAREATEIADGRMMDVAGVLARRIKS